MKRRRPNPLGLTRSEAKTLDAIVGPVPRRKRGTTLDMLVAPALYEVVREHPATCRSQLVAWDLPKDEARMLAILSSRSDGKVEIDGKLEYGWRHRARERGGA